MGLCAVSDLVIAEAGARFGFTETRLGILPAVIFVGLWMLVMKRMNPQSGLMSIGKSRAKVYVEHQTGVTFDDTVCSL